MMNIGFSCSYTLVSYDKNYSKYLEAFGVPSAIISMFILGASETINVTRTDESIRFMTQMGGIEHMYVGVLSTYLFAFMKAISM